MTYLHRTIFQRLLKDIFNALISLKFRKIVKYSEPLGRLMLNVFARITFTAV